MVNWLPRIDEAWRDKTFHITLEITQQRPAYKPGEEPRWGESRGPSCQGLPGKVGTQEHPWTGNAFDDGTDHAGSGASSALPSIVLRHLGAGHRRRRLRARGHRAGAAGRGGPAGAVTATPRRSRPCSLGPMLRGTVVNQQMSTRSSLVKFVIFVVATLLATGTLAATIANTQFGDKATYRGVFKDVTGLAAGQEVRIAGVRVGEVKSIKVASDRVHAGSSSTC